MVLLTIREAESLGTRKSGNTFRDMVPLKTVLEIMTVLVFRFFFFQFIVLPVNLHFKIMKFKNKTESFCQDFLDYKKKSNFVF